MKKLKKFLLLFCLMFAVSGCGGEAEQMIGDIVQSEEFQGFLQEELIDKFLQEEGTTKATVTAGDGELEVHYIDVGQADCALLASDGHYMLIDGGNNEDAEEILSYLEELGVKKLDFVVGTHPHEDHIGSLDVVIESFDVGAVYMPKITHTSQTFEDVLTAISDKGLKVKTPTPGSTFKFAGLPVEIIGPVTEYRDFNNNSIVLRVTAGETRFLFTGDAEGMAEDDIRFAGYDVEAEVLKVGHHGSATSSTYEFLDAINPEYAVISVGVDNSYDHPEQETLDRLEAVGAKIYRTDLQGTIICRTNGKDITFETAGKSVSTSTEIKEVQYIGNKNSKKFHYLDCSSLPTEKNRAYLTSREGAIEEGYTPCGDCKP